MKRKTTISAIALCLCLLLSGCGEQAAQPNTSQTGSVADQPESTPVSASQPESTASKPSESVSDDKQFDSKYAEFIETDLSKFEDDDLLGGFLEQGDAPFGYNPDYLSVDTFLYDICGEEKANEYFNEVKENNRLMNVVDFVKYANISKEDYIAAVEKIYTSGDEEWNRYMSNIEIIYCGDETKIDNYFNYNSRSFNAEYNNVTEPTKNFFCIHGALLRYVDYAELRKYLGPVYSTKYDNVKNFIEYFKIDRSTFEEIMKKAEASDFYNIDDLF
ncbi:MAG: hypothetical protein K2J80_01555 [Oscillospiraceae bacterium]|nr:hypothetical protein [Oscillospiraceae bacterium]